MANKYFRKSKLTLAQQVAAMKKWFPSFKLDWKRNRAIWTGEVQPTSASARYRVKIEYSLEKLPKVWVISPKLVERLDDKIPHIYPDKSLCLYLRRTSEWTANMFIAETIVPWTSLWLYYYEIWHVIGSWFGGGVHP